MFDDTDFRFYCVASRDLPGTQIHSITRIVVDFRSSDSPKHLRFGFRVAKWDAFVHSAQKFPHLREFDVVINDWSYNGNRRWLMWGLVSSILLDSPELQSFLRLYDDKASAENPDWTPIELKTIVEEMIQVRHVVQCCDESTRHNTISLNHFLSFFRGTAHPLSTLA